MTPADALRVLDIATNPANAGKLSRVDYANTETALVCLAQVVKEAEAAKAPPKEP